MSILFKKYKIYSIFLIGIISIFLIISNSINEFSKEFNSNNLSDEFMIYVPNTYLKYRIRNYVIDNLSLICDTNKYQFYDIGVCEKHSNGKSLNLTLIDKRIIESSNISLNLNNHTKKIKLFIQQKDKEFKLIAEDSIYKKELLSIKYDSLLVMYNDPKNPFRYNDKVKISFSQNGIYISYIRDNIKESNYQKQIDSLKEYQVLGISFLLGYNLLDKFTSNKGIVLNLSSVFKDTSYLKDVKLISGYKNYLYFNSSLYNTNPIFMPTKLNFKLKINNITNSIDSVYDYNYSNNGLGTGEQVAMDSIIQKANRIISKGIIKRPLLPQMKGLEFEFKYKQNSIKYYPSDNGFIQFKKNIIIITSNSF